jgi:hypothetical protein
MTNINLWFGWSLLSFYFRSINAIIESVFEFLLKLKQPLFSLGLEFLKLVLPLFVFDEVEHSFLWLFLR